ncbi:MAG: exo-alpha-sialidase [Bacteroidales bacterium]|nr:exo-alpha-sialidase [Bacteroidales bacterium]
MTRKFVCSILMFAAALPAFADIHRGDVRIAWDQSTFQVMDSVAVSNADYKIEPNLCYPRAKHLSDGSILLSFENDHYGWDVYIRKSYDGGKTWTDARLLRKSHDCESTVGADKKVFVNPDYIQLASGRILMAWQWRYKKGYNDLPNTNRNCGIEMIYSDDSGETWSEPREVYRGRCWEPAFLELPSGEIQMYITDSQEIKDKGSFACTSVIRSFDGGKTWQGKEMCDNLDTEPISRTRWNGRGMDGMPTAVLLDGGRGIVVPLETWSGRDVYDISPIVVRTTMDINWKTADRGAALRANGGPDYPMKKQVNKDFKGFGPYSCKLSSGEMVILSNGMYKNESGVWVLVGDKDGDNFNCVSSAFDDGADGYWGSIDALNANELMATCSYRYRETPESAQRYKIMLIKGWLNRSRTIVRSKKAPAVQSLREFKPDGLWMLGKGFPGKVYVDFAYDPRYFYLTSYVFTDNIVSYSPENSDAAQILLNRAGKGTWKITVNAKGDYTVYKEDASSWKLLCWEYGKAEVKLFGSVNDDAGADVGYSALAALPWDLLGGAPKKGEQLRIHLRRIWKSGAKVKAKACREATEGENPDYPGEWLGVTLK